MPRLAGVRRLPRGATSPDGPARVRSSESIPRGSLPRGGEHSAITTGGLPCAGPSQIFQRFLDLAQSFLDPAETIIRA